MENNARNYAGTGNAILGAAELLVWSAFQSDLRCRLAKLDQRHKLYHLSGLVRQPVPGFVVYCSFVIIQIVNTYLYLFQINRLCCNFSDMKQSIELFSGSGTISRILEQNGFETFTVDFNSKLKPDLCIDICDLVCDQLPAPVKFMWASPDCSKFSRSAAQANWIKSTKSYRIYDYQPATPAAQKSIDLLTRTVELIKELNPAVWFLENPVGRIPHMSPLKSIGHYRYCVNYAEWGFPYGKETYLFTNQLLPLPTRVIKTVGIGVRSVHNSYNRSLVPPALVQFLIDHSQF